MCCATWSTIRNSRRPTRRSWGRKAISRFGRAAKSADHEDYDDHETHETHERRMNTTETPRHRETGRVRASRRDAHRTTTGSQRALRTLRSFAFTLLGASEPPWWQFRGDPR